MTWRNDAHAMGCVALPLYKFANHCILKNVIFVHRLSIFLHSDSYNPRRNSDIRCREIYFTFSDNELAVVVVVDLVKLASAELATMTGAGATLSLAALAAASWFFFFS